MIKLLFSILQLSSAILLSACTYNKVHDSTPSSEVSAESLESIDYAAIRTKVIAPKCLGCHSQSSGNQGGINLENLPSIRRNLSRIAFRTLERRDMPPSGLDERDLQILRNWIELGTPETLIGPQDVSSDPPIEQGPNDWAKIRDRIFSAKCLDCHSGKDPQGGLDLSTLGGTRAKATAIFERVIIQGNMPLLPYPALSPRERRVLLKWFDLGMPE